MFPGQPRAAALCTADDSTGALGGSRDSIPIAVWVFKLLCEISARILSRVPLPSLAFCFLFDLGRATVLFLEAQENFVASLLWAQPECVRTILLAEWQVRWLVCALDFSAPLFCSGGLQFLPLDATNRLVEDFFFFFLIIGFLTWAVWLICTITELLRSLWHRGYMKSLEWHWLFCALRWSDNGGLSFPALSLLHWEETLGYQHNDETEKGEAWSPVSADPVRTVVKSKLHCNTSNWDYEKPARIFCGK